MNMHPGSTAEQAIVVGVDHSESTRMAGEWAADLAAAWRAPLHLVHLVREREPLAPPSWLTELAAAVGRIGVDRCSVDVVAGEVAEVLAERSGSARLLALGSYGHGADTGALAGEVGLALLERAACPLAVVRGPNPGVPPARNGPVVVGVDGGVGGRAALAFAADLAEAVGARVDAVHAWTDVVTSASGATRREADVAAVEAEGGALLDAELRWITSLRPGLAVESELVADTTTRALLGRAAGARAVVVGHRRHAPESELRLGSTAQALVAFAPCPVVVLGPRCLGAASEPSGDRVTADR